MVVDGGMLQMVVPWTRISRLMKDFTILDLPIIAQKLPVGVLLPAGPITSSWLGPPLLPPPLLLLLHLFHMLSQPLPQLLLK